MIEKVFEARGLVRGSSGPALQTFLQRQQGIHHAEANAMSDTVTVGYEETAISETDIRRLIEVCGYHCRGEMLPNHICAPEAGVAVDHFFDDFDVGHVHVALAIRIGIGRVVIHAVRRAIAHDTNGLHAGHAVPLIVHRRRVAARSLGRVRLLREDHQREQRVQRAVPDLLHVDLRIPVRLLVHVVTHDRTGLRNEEGGNQPANDRLPALHG